MPTRGRTTKQQFERVSVAPAAPLLITDGVEVTGEAVWAWLRIPAGSTYLLEDAELGEATMETSASMGSLLPAGAEYHIKVVWSQHSSSQYRESWENVQSVRAPGSPDYIALGADRIQRNTDDGHFRKRIVLLGVRWPEGHGGSTIERAGRLARRTLHSTRSTVADARRRLEAAQTAIDRWSAAMARGPLRAEPAPAGLIAWAYAREMRRVALDVPGERALAGPALVSLMHGEMDPTVSPNYVVVTDAKTGIRSYVAILVPAVNGFPVEELEIPGGQWLEILTELPFTVEASVRGINHGQTGSIELIDAARKMSRSQGREASSHGAQVPSEVAAAEEALGARRVEVVRRIDTMTENHARWVVTADDPDTLADRIAELRQRYDGIVTLDVVPYVQGLLWQELLPGDRVRVPEYGQDQPMRTLAGSWFHGGSAIGDDTGPYIGANLGSTPGPVQVHVVSRAQQDRRLPTTVSFTGRSGSGKSTAVMLTVAGALSEGAWVLLVDPKGDLRGILEVASRMLGVPVQVVDVVEASSSGIMDPMRFSATPDEARSQTLDAMLGVLPQADRPHAETLIETAIENVLTEPRLAWSAQAVISNLLATPQSAPRWEQARELGTALSQRARQAHIRAVLGPLHADARPLMTGRGLVYLGLAGLDMPRHTPDPDTWSVTQRCSIVTFRIAMSFALQQSRHVREFKKLVALTELHLITGYAEGKQFVEWIARTGRALQLWQLLDTQAAQDLSELTGLVEQLVMSFAFQATGRTEQNAQAVLLGRPDPGPRLRQQQSELQVGQCIMRDRHGRVAPVEFDRLSEWIAAAISTNPEEDSEAAGGFDHPAPRPGKAAANGSGPVCAAPPETTLDQATAGVAGTEQP